MKNQIMRNQKGFTLIELALVLVIIGILLGAIWKGSKLIGNTQTLKESGAIEALVSKVIGSYCVEKPSTLDINNDGNVDYEVKYNCNPQSIENSYMILCKDASCSTNFGEDDIDLFSRFDARIDDGIPNQGNVVGGTQINGANPPDIDNGDLVSDWYDPTGNAQPDVKAVKIKFELVN